MPPRAITQICPQCQMPLVLPASFAGKTVPCSRCGHAVLVSAAETPPPPSVIPPHLEQLATKASPVVVEQDVDLEPAPRRSCLFTGCMTIAVATLALAGAVGVALLTVYFIGSRQPPVTVDPKPDMTLNKRDYTDASRRSKSIDGVTVRVDKVQVGKVDYRSKGEILQTATPHYLIVNVNVKNKDRDEPVEYRSWYDEPEVELLDENGRGWKRFPVPGADKVELHVKSRVELPLADDITDSLIFKLPEEYHDEPIPPLYLKLPGTAVGHDRPYRFHLPGIMVDRRDK